MNSDNRSVRSFVEPQSAFFKHGKSRRIHSDFCALEFALLFDDIVGALDAFSRLQEDSPPLAMALSRDPFPSDTGRLRALRELGQCLLAGDLNGAKRASQRFQ